MEETKKVDQILKMMESMSVRDVTKLMERVFVAGMPMPSLAPKGDKIREFLKSNKIEAMSGAQIAEQIRVGSMMPRRPEIPQLAWVHELVWEEEAGLPNLPNITAGVLAMPHLHDEGLVYALNDKEWGKFAAEHLPDININVSAGNAISFNNYRQLNDVASRVGK